MTSRYLPKVLFAVFLCASPVDVSAGFEIDLDPYPHQSEWMPTPEELMKFKKGTAIDRPNFCKANLSGRQPDRRQPDQSQPDQSQPDQSQPEHAVNGKVNMSC